MGSGRSSNAHRPRLPQLEGRIFRPGRGEWWGVVQGPHPGRYSSVCPQGVSMGMKSLFPTPACFSFNLDAGNRGEWFKDPVLDLTLHFVEKVWTRLICCVHCVCMMARISAKIGTPLCVLWTISSWRYRTSTQFLPRNYFFPHPRWIWRPWLCADQPT